MTRLGEKKFQNSLRPRVDTSLIMWYNIIRGWELKSHLLLLKGLYCMKKVVDKVGTKTQVAKVMADEGLSKSAKMRGLFDLGLDIKDISEACGVRYNFVYNVISNYVNINDIDVEKTQTSGKKDMILSLHLEGKTKTEISKLLKTNYNYVYKVIKDFQGEQAAALDMTEAGGAQ